MFKKMTTILLVIAIISFCNTPVLSRGIYDDDLTEILGTLREVMMRVDKINKQDANDRLIIKKELYDITTKAHRLGEEALTADLRRNEKGSKSDRQLLLTVVISEYVSISASCLGYYLDTNDRIFWTTAAQAAKTARELLARS